MEASALSDPDGGETNEKWQWARSTDMETWTDIDGGHLRSPVCPTADDVGSYLRATVTYTDSFGSGKSASAVTDNMVEAKTVANARPLLQRTRTQTRPLMSLRCDPGRSTKTPMWAPPSRQTVSATDADNDVLEYSLNGTDKDQFEIDPATGQVKTKVKLNFEAAAAAAENCDTRNGCVVTVTATDPSGAETPQNVNITIVNVNEAPKFNDDFDADTNGAQDRTTVLYVAENQTGNAEQIQYRVGSTSTNLSSTAYAVSDQDTIDLGSEASWTGATTSLRSGGPRPEVLQRSSRWNPVVPDLWIPLLLTTTCRTTKRRAPTP